tara:strand:- start:2671 stop:3297 length:627 start_codon:yes stop_codon:yes gene_type:complete
MNLLAIESSSRKLIVGLYLNSKIFKLSEEKINDTASSLPLLTKEILSNNSVKLNDLEGICLSKGPGSFTSLRIGMSFVKGLSMSADIPILPISTFDSLIYNKAFNCSALIYSHGETFYLCNYNFKNDQLKKSQPKLVSFKEVLELKNKIIYNGPKSIFNNLELKKIDIEYVDLSIENIIEIAKNEFNFLKTKSLDELIPDYIGNFKIR